MAPGRLLQNSRRRAEPSSASASGHRQVDASDELPPYEAPSQPLNDAARRALAQISNNRSTRKFDNHLKKATELIRDAVGVTNDRAWENHATLQQRAEKLAQTGRDKTEDDVDFENYVAKFGDDIAMATVKLEAALRDVIDYRVELEDEPVVLEMVCGELESQAQSWRPRKAESKSKRKEPRPSAAGSLDDTVNGAENEEEEEENEEDSEMRGPEDNIAVASVNEVLQKVRQAKAEEWTGMDMGQRYASHNDYVLFKRTLHDAQHPEGDATLPHRSAWFGPDGQPVLSKIGETDAPGDEEDDELQVAGEKRTFRCPLSLQIIAEPYSNNKCKHTFEKTAIIGFIGSNRVVQCPESGCSQQLSLQDFFLDKILLRKIKRQQQADAQKEKDDFGMEQDEEQVDEDGDTLITGSQRNIKSERRRSRRVVDDIEDDEDDE